MDYDQALRIACFYGMIIEVESLLWMEADPASVLFNHRDRGTAFHPSVNPAVRDGVNELLSESSEEEAAAAEDGPDGRRRSTVGEGAAAAAALKAAREAAAAWEEAGGGESGNPNGSSAASTATSGWTSGGGDSSSCRDGGGYQSSSAASDDGGAGGGRRVRPSFGLGREDLPTEEEEDDVIDESDDAFILPSMLTLENDLIREDGSFYANNAGQGKNNKNSFVRSGSSSVAAAGAAASLASTGAVAAMRRFGQRVREGVAGPTTAGTRGRADSSDSGGVEEDGGGGSGGGDCPVSPTHGLVRAKEKARAKLAGVIKWAQSPRRALSPRRGWTEGLAG